MDSSRTPMEEPLLAQSGNHYTHNLLPTQISRSRGGLSAYWRSETVLLTLPQVSKLVCCATIRLYVKKRVSSKKKSQRSVLLHCCCSQLPYHLLHRCKYTGTKVYCQDQETLNTKSNGVPSCSSRRLFFGAISSKQADKVTSLYRQMA